MLYFTPYTTKDTLVFIFVFQLHLEAAHVLKYSEEEFLQTLDWKPLPQNGTEKSGKNLFLTFFLVL